MLLTTKQVCELTTLSRFSIYRLEQKKAFPKRIKLLHNRVAWRRDDVIAWIDKADQAGRR